MLAKICHAYTFWEYCKAHSGDLKRFGVFFVNIHPPPLPLSDVATVNGRSDWVGQVLDVTETLTIVQGPICRFSGVYGGDGDGARAKGIAFLTTASAMLFEAQRQGSAQDYCLCICGFACKSLN